VKERQGRRCLTINRDTIQVGEKAFNFEAVFDEDTNQALIYGKCVKHLVEGCFQGYNGTVFACT
jgi:kinesin family protein 4/21/27